MRPSFIQIATNSFTLPQANRFEFSLKSDRITDATTTGSVTPKPRRIKGSLSAGEAPRALVASSAIGAILLVAFFVGTGSYFSAERRLRLGNDGMTDREIVRASSTHGSSPPKPGPGFFI